ncbi:MAG: FMN-binding negative transcriptional regulator [Gammaproteobacteria bacterium]
MYTPEQFAVSDIRPLQEVIRRHPLGLLITLHADTLHTTHLPFHLDPAVGEFGRLEAHLARVNPHCEALRSGAASMVVFRGPDAYISPRWYTDPARNVPTWNYVAVHAHGNPRFIDDPARILGIIGTLTDEHERYIENPWRIEEARPYAERLVSQIMAFEIDILRLEGKFKLSQNRLPADRAGVLRALAGARQGHNQELLEMMQALYTTDGDLRNR